MEFRIMFSEKNGFREELWAPSKSEDSEENYKLEIVAAGNNA